VRAVAVPVSAASMPAPSITGSCVAASVSVPSVPLRSVRVSTTTGPNADTSPIRLAIEFDRGALQVQRPLPDAVRGGPIFRQLL
jgi:hypothetical protein